WREPEWVAATAAPAGAGRFQLTEPGAMALVANNVTVNATRADGGTIVLAVGREADVVGWVGQDPYSLIGGLADWDTLSTTALNPEGAITADNPAGSDLWVAESVADGTATLRWDDRPGRWVLLAASVGDDAPAPVVEFSWRREVTTPLVAPLVIPGGFLIVVGLAWLAFSLRRGRAVPEPKKPQATVDTADLKDWLDDENSLPVEASPASATPTAGALIFAPVEKADDSAAVAASEPAASPEADTTSASSAPATPKPGTSTPGTSAETDEAPPITSSIELPSRREQRAQAAKRRRGGQPASPSSPPAAFPAGVSDETAGTKPEGQPSVSWAPFGQASASQTSAGPSPDAPAGRATAATVPAAAVPDASAPAAAPDAAVSDAAVPSGPVTASVNLPTRRQLREAALAQRAAENPSLAARVKGALTGSIPVVAPPPRPTPGQEEPEAPEQTVTGLTRAVRRTRSEAWREAWGIDDEDQQDNEGAGK
ncbi:MAG: hypothetical protein FWG11_05880, partial [Promicromonosporaceae bacterium]|nr:hypothetical protein [Promicromonosporaceae bacterium]